MIELENLDSYRRPYTDLVPDFESPSQKRHQYEYAAPRVSETIDLSELSKHYPPMEDLTVLEKPKEQNLLMEKYMLRLLMNSDQIAKKMMFHDLVSFRLARGERPDFVMK